MAAADRAGIDLGAEICPATVKGVGWLLNEAAGLEKKLELLARSSSGGARQEIKQKIRRLKAIRREVGMNCGRQFFIVFPPSRGGDA